MDIWHRTFQTVRDEACCHHYIGYSFQLAAKVLLYASHKHDRTYHGLSYTSRGALVGSQSSSMGPPQCLIDGDWLKMICKYMDSNTAPPNPAYTELISHLTTQCLIDGDWLKMICTYMDYHCTTLSSLHWTNLSPDNPVSHWWGLT